ncbi:hypothetical protein BDV33DRAFT_210171 [Aspergillus novoparasiticus]|uniref:DNA/RNA-binding domain-containing protein n=1 Tax=Aspergillus novoparasiticus TaxID=986946 RepID=A0A5N6E9K1_9EURO|nr:hypothetical protein BDV33DRAFT_210171 [Aspergillus novoparasiticus]
MDTQKECEQFASPPYEDQGHSTATEGRNRRRTLQPEVNFPTDVHIASAIRERYDELVRVEKQCIDGQERIRQGQVVARHQWQALVVLHRNLLERHYDLFMLSQHRSANLVWNELSEEHMATRIWRYGIHRFLHQLYCRLPDSLEYMLTYIYLAYSMLTLLLQTVPALEQAWVECLGNLSRYGVIIENRGLVDGEIWVGIARDWFNKAADQSPDVGRIQHCLGVLAWSDMVQQLFYYMKSLISIRPYPPTRVSLVRFFSPFVQGRGGTGYPRVLTTYLSIHWGLFTQASGIHFVRFADEFLSSLEWEISLVAETFRMRGVYLMCSNLAAMLEYGSSDSLLGAEFHPVSSDQSNPGESFPTRVAPAASADEALARFLIHGTRQYPCQMVYGTCLAFEVFSVLLGHPNNVNLFPTLHISLAFIWCLSSTAAGMRYVESVVPWNRIVIFLNTILRPSFLRQQGPRRFAASDELDLSLIEGIDFPFSPQTSWLPEDFLIRGQLWSQAYYPSLFFQNCPSEGDGRNVENGYLSISRIYRCLWLGMRLARVNRWITYNTLSRQFSMTPFAQELDNALQTSQPQVDPMLPGEARALKYRLLRLIYK